jgi:magnesium-transporting ATPase (P-type)
MRKTILTYGLIGGFIVSTVMVISFRMYDNNTNYEPGMLVGYASMVAAFSMIFVGIKNYRDKFLDGYITFGKAFKMGLWIALIASTMYVITWLIYYYFFIPDFMEKYSQMALNNLTKHGATATEIAAKTEEMKMYAEMYKNPLFVILLTYSEVFPIGLVIALITAAILKRKPNL